MIPKDGLEHELGFWKGFVRTDRFLNGWVADIKTPELNQDVADFILSVPHGAVLDAGSGVVSILNGLISKDNIVAIDPLGLDYRKIFDYERYQLRAPLAFKAEEVYLLRCDCEFDIVHISNALDHTQDPVKAYESLLKTVVPGGYLIVQGFENEGIHENWQGFHQWNLSVKDNTLILADKTGECWIWENPHICKTVTFENGRNWIIWIVKK